MRLPLFFCVVLASFPNTSRLSDGASFLYTYFYILVPPGSGSGCPSCASGFISSLITTSRSVTLTSLYDLPQSVSHPLLVLFVVGSGNPACSPIGQDGRVMGTRGVSRQDERLGADRQQEGRVVDGCRRSRTSGGDVVRAGMRSAAGHNPKDSALCVFYCACC